MTTTTTNPYVNTGDSTGGPPPPPPKWSTVLHDRLHLWLSKTENQDKLLKFIENSGGFDKRLVLAGEGHKYIQSIEHERPLFTGYNRAYLAYMADAVIDMGFKIAIICEMAILYISL
jgi:hypothetical protein